MMLSSGICAVSAPLPSTVSLGFYLIVGSAPAHQHKETSQALLGGIMNYGTKYRQKNPRSPCSHDINKYKSHLCYHNPDEAN